MIFKVNRILTIQLIGRTVERERSYAMLVWCQVWINNLDIRQVKSIL